jgi:hypothetical protein
MTLKEHERPLVASHVAAPGISSNWDATAAKLPLCRLDRDPKGDPETLAASHQPTCVFPLSCVMPPQERRGSGGRVEEGRGRSRAPRRHRCVEAGGRPWSSGAGAVAA